MAGKKGMKGGMKGSRRPLNKQQQMMMMQGDGFLDVVKDVAGKANEFLKDTKILSTVAGLIPPQTPYIGKVAQVGAPVLKSLGYGKQMGMGVISTPNGVISTPNPEKPYSVVIPVGQNQVQTGAGKRKTLKF